MENKQQPKQSQLASRQRKMLFMLPVFLVPLLTAAFYALGGGKGTVDAKTDTGTKGYNTTLPSPHFDKKDSKMDKLAFYNKADMDSMRLRSMQKDDPYHLTPPPDPTVAQKSVNPFGVPPNNLSGLSKGKDTAADALLKRLDKLKEALHQPANPVGTLYSENPSGNTSLPTGSPETEKLEKLMQQLKAGQPATNDPQLDKLSGMLDKILQIQNPASATGKESAADTLPGKSSVLEIQKTAKPDMVDNMAGNQETTLLSAQDAFQTIGENDHSDAGVPNVFSAVVQSDQTLVSGATLALRLTEDALINGNTIPKDNLVYGQVSLNGERMNVAINSIRYRNAIYPVSLQVFDLDGMPGIHIPGAINRDVSKESADQAISSIGMTTTMDPSLGAQAAGAGIQAAKTLISRKVRLIRVSVKSGYQVFLKNIKK